MTNSAAASFFVDGTTANNELVSFTYQWTLDKPM